ncbi:15167_t:CDS:1, partial [Acaulospora colombiana]
KLQEELKRLKDENETIREELLYNKSIDEQHKERLDKIISLVNRKTLAEQLNEELQEENHKVKELYNQLNKEFNDIVSYQQQEIKKLQTREQILETKLSSFETERNLLNNRNKILKDQVSEIKETFKTKYEEKIKGLEKRLKESMTTLETSTLEYEERIRGLNKELKELKKYEQISQKIMEIFKRKKIQEK